MIGLTPPLEGGSERHIYEISERMKNCTVLTQRGSICRNKIELPVFFSNTLVRNLSFMIGATLYSVLLLCSFRKRYNVVHIHENLLYFLAPFLRIRYKVIVTVHGIKGFKFYDQPVLWKLFKAELQYANALIAVSPEDKKKLSKEFENAFYIPNGVDLSLYETLNVKVARKIVFIGRIHEQKGVKYLLKAFSEIKKKEPGYSLELIGTLNPYSEELRKQFPDKDIHWLGFIKDRKKIAQHLVRAYCIVLPSLWEGLPLTLFESLASGRPVVVSDIPAFQSVVKDQVIFFPSENSDSLARKILYVIENPRKAEQFGEKGRTLAQKYDWLAITKRIEKVYTSP